MLNWRAPWFNNHIKTINLNKCPGKIDQELELFSLNGGGMRKKWLFVLISVGRSLRFPWICVALALLNLQLKD